MGLNLKEKSSGTVHGQIKITKRGPSRALASVARRKETKARVNGRITCICSNRSSIVEIGGWRNVCPTVWRSAAERKMFNNGRTLSNS